MACLPIGARCGSFKAGLESRKAVLHFWHSWTEAARPLSYLHVSASPLVGCEERVRRKSPTEATFPKEPLKSVSFTTVPACQLEKIELTTQAALLSHTPGRVLSGLHLRGVFGKYHLSQSDLQLLIQPPPPPRDKGGNLNTSHSCGVRV